MGKIKYAILILAAGGSERLGRPKQTVEWNQTTLLNHTIEQALKVENTDVFVVLGGNQTGVLPSISHNIPIVYNSNWQGGMGTSISNGLSQIAIEEYDAVILSVCDQPYISNVVFNDLITTFETRKATIVISKYQKLAGPPTLFDKKHFPSLLKLKGDSGAKEIVQRHNDEISNIIFLEGDFDIDTEEDLKLLLQSNRK